MVRPVILCSIESRRVRCVIESITRDLGLGASVRHLPQDGDLPNMRDLAWSAAYVTDLFPNPGARIAEMHHLRAIRPRIPLLVYVYAMPESVPLLARLGAAFPELTACAQRDDREDWQTLARFLKRAVTRLPSNRVQETLLEVPAFDAPWVRRFVDIAVEAMMIGEEQSVEKIALKIGESPKHLRQMASHGYQWRPKRLLTWVEVLFGLQLALSERISIRDVAGILPVDDRGWNRKLARIGLSRLRDLDPESAWDVAVTALHQVYESRIIDDRPAEACAS